MVRQEKRVLQDHFKVKTAGFIGQLLFLINSYSMRFKNVNVPDTKNQKFIFACYHSQQCGVYSIPNREKLYSMVSYSTDGDLIVAAGGRVGVKTVRGSSKRGGVSGTIELIEKIKERNSIVIAIDGPKGPVYVPKKGVVEIAKLTGIPIIPMVWHGNSPFLLKLPTWDKLLMPLVFVNTVTLYGDPIYVPSDSSKEEFEQIRLQLEDTMKKLNVDVKENFKKYYKIGIQNKEKSKSIVKWF